MNFLHQNSGVITEDQWEDIMKIDENHDYANFPTDRGRRHHTVNACVSALRRSGVS